MAGIGAAFDQSACSYDELWTTAPAGRLQREAVWRNLTDCFRSGQHVLDLGCGTGADGAWLSKRGISVSAIDASPEMVSVALRRGLDARVLKIEDVARLEAGFDGALSNFGAFNCIEAPEKLGSVIASRLSAGAYFSLCVMGRFCLWETMWFLLRGKFRKAARRWRGSARADTLSIPVTYHSVSRLRRAFAPDFDLVRVIGIGIAVPPSYVKRLPAACFNILGWIDRCAERFPLVSALADHRLLIFVRR